MPPEVLLTAENLCKAFGAQRLFEELSLSLFAGDRVGLVGPNGAGKSTLLAILAGAIEPDAGQVSQRRGLRVGTVEQDPAFPPGRTVEAVVLERLQGETSATHSEPWERQHRAAVALSQAGFESVEAGVETLSGGWRKRLAIARELAAAPDILLLDEPTNHLDVASILWLEELLSREPSAFVTISHDRVFLQRVCHRIIEIDRVYDGGRLEVDGTYADYLEAREQRLSQQAAQRASLANRVRTEVEWLRTGPKARTTKSKARTDQALAMIDDLADQSARARSKRASIDFDASERRTRKLWRGRGLSKAFGDLTLFEDLDLQLGPGDRLGVLGTNGSGKTSLLRILVGELEPDRGTIQRAEQLRTVYFEQDRTSLDPTLTLRRALAPTGDTVFFRDQPLHVASWAARFLFRGEQLETPVESLSGGERARIVLARLMLQPADLLVLDEPTNDLDIATLDVLEDALCEFPGALVLVTHDRYLLDRVSTRLLALDRGRAIHFADTAQWESHLRQAARAAEPAEELSKPASSRPNQRRRRLSYLDQREFDAMESRVLEAEEELASLRQAAEDPAIATDPQALQERFEALAAGQRRVDALYARWAELEAKT